jgi:hypothetical protein
MGYTQSLKALQKESGNGCYHIRKAITYDQPLLIELRHTLVHMQWDAAIGIIHTFNCDAETLSRVETLIYEQKYLNLLLQGQT